MTRGHEDAGVRASPIAMTARGMISLISVAGQALPARHHTTRGVRSTSSLSPARVACTQTLDRQSTTCGRRRRKFTVGQVEERPIIRKCYTSRAKNQPKNKPFGNNVAGTCTGGGFRGSNPPRKLCCQFASKMLKETSACSLKPAKFFFFFSIM